MPNATIAKETSRQKLALLNTHQTAPDFKRIRKYLKDVEQREGLGRFIKAGWTHEELAEYARMYLIPGRTHPTAASYQFITETRPDCPIASAVLKSLRAPGYIMPPFDRPVPKRYQWDDIDNPDHTPEIRSDVDVIARLYRDRQSDRLGMPRVACDEPVPRWLWRRAYRLRNRYHSLEDTLDIQNLREPLPGSQLPCKQISALQPKACLDSQVGC